jgi:ribosomal protein S4E
LTFGELAYSDLNEKLFVGDAAGNSIWVGAQITAGSLSTNSQYFVPTQSAVKTYVDGVVGGGSVVNTLNGTGGNLTVTGSGAITQTVSGTTTTFGARVSSTSVTGVASFNNVHFTVDTTGHVKLATAYQVTGQTVVSGGASQLVSTSGNTVTIDNRVATSSVTGVASFNGTRFTVSAAGAVDLATAYQVTGDTVQAGSFINIGAGKTINNIGVQTFNGLTGAITLTGDGGSQSVVGNNTITNRIATASLTGVAAFSSTYYSVSASGVVTPTAAFQVTGDTVQAGSFINIGAGKTINNIGVQTFNGATGAVSFTVPLATTSLTGTASFNPNRFQVSATGNVDLLAAFQVTGQTVVSGGASQLVSTSGNTVTIDNRIATSSVTGVASFNGTRFTVSAAGAVDLAAAFQVTGDTIQAGSFINIGAGKTINNIGVQTFNGATGAVTFTVPLATNSLTGTASFNPTRFTVSATGNVDLATGGIANSQLANSSITIKAGSAEAGQAISLGSSFSITGTANQVSVSRSTSEFTIGLPNDVTIPGNLTVNGTVVTANVDSFVVEDPLFMLGTGNAADSVDLGFYGQYTSSGKRFAGIFRDASDSGKFKFFTGLSGGVEPTTFVNDAGSGYTVATVVAKIDGGTF